MLSPHECVVRLGCSWTPQARQHAEVQDVDDSVAVEAGQDGASVAARTCLSPRLMAYAQHVREHFPRAIAGTTVADLDALADDVCTSLNDFPLTTGVLGIHP